ncbi:MAG: S9 family peptidase [Trueperaceae bacterium]|nr:MAG: S9 family peptidase [Trueperaceae bacterium]
MPTQDNRRGLIPEDLLEFRWLESLALDPTGTRVAYTIKRVDPVVNGYVSDLYVRALDGGAPLRVTERRGMVLSLAWSPDGLRLAYSSNGDASHEVAIWSVESGERERYPLEGEPLTALDWSPQGDKLVGVRWTLLRQDREQAIRPGIPTPNMKVVRRLRYKQDGVGFVHDRFSQIWVLELPSGDLHQVTRSECDYSEPKWSHAGDRIAFIGLAREQNQALGQGQIFVCTYPGGEPERLLPDWQGACRSPAWGQNDDAIAFAGHEHPAPTNRRVFMTPYLADVHAATARPLAPRIDQEVGNYAASDSRQALSNVTVRWASDDPWIYFLLTVEGTVELRRIDTSGRFETLLSGPRVVFEYSPAAGDRVAFGAADPTNPGDLYLWRAGEVERLTALNTWLADHRLVRPEAYWFDGVDGVKVHGWLMKPPGFDASKTYPAIVYVHCSMFSWDFSHEFQCLVQAGYVLTYFNQRGTTAGYGQAWTRASEGDQGGKDFDETMLGVDHLLERPYVDAARLGVTGGSCGGFMTNWIVGHTNRFAAAVTQRSITNQISFFGTADIGPECTEGETGTNAFRDLDSSWRQSPLAYAEAITTPLLILHSDQDHRCPLEQAEQLFAALRWLGREVELVIFEGESHGLSRGGRPGNRIGRLRQILGWFEQYLGTDAR